MTWPTTAAGASGPEPPGPAEPPEAAGSDQPTWPPRPLAWPAHPLSDGVVALDEMGTDDVDRLVLGAGDADTAHWLPVPHPYTERDAREFLEVQRAGADEGHLLNFAVRRAGRPELCGSLGIALEGRPGEAEVGYWLAPDARGEGLAWRGVRLAARHAVAALGCHRVELLVHPSNLASHRTCRRAGATREGLRRAGLVRAGEDPVDADVYSLLPADLESPKAAQR